MAVGPISQISGQLGIARCLITISWNDITQLVLLRIRALNPIVLSFGLGHCTEVEILIIEMMHLRLQNAGNILYINSYIYIYYIHVTSMSDASSNTEWSDGEIILKKPAGWSGQTTCGAKLICVLLDICLEKSCNRFLEWIWNQTWCCWVSGMIEMIDHGCFRRLKYPYYRIGNLLVGVAVVVV